MTIKKTLLLLAVAGIGLTSCQPKQGAPTASNVPVVDTTDINQITVETAKKYVNGYKHRADMVDSIGGDGKPIHVLNTRAIWLDTARLVKMLAKIRKEKGDGIRIYLATYPPNVGANAGTTAADKYAGRNTFVLVSTKDSVNKVNEHFHRDYYTTKTANGPGLGFIVGTPPQNRGEMCPPPSNCPGIGATLITP